MLQREPVIAELLRVAPALPEALVVQARLLAAQRQDAKALAILSLILWTGATVAGRLMAYLL